MSFDVDIDMVGGIGLVKDQVAYKLPPEAWNEALNVRFFAKGCERIGGWSQILGSPMIAPHFILPVQGPSNNFIVYVSLTAAAVWDGTTNTNITRGSGAYNATETRDWNGTLLGPIPILNNGVDVPQFWADTDTSVDLADLTNWPSTLRAKVIRALGPFLIAGGLTDDGEARPHRVRWSHPADPGSVPVTWDVSDTTKLAGEIDLPDVESGLIQDMLELNGDMMVYKSGSATRLRFIGGNSVFDRDTYLSTVGVLAPRCVCLGPDGASHVMATNDDIIVHNGQGEPVSILDKRMRRYLFQQIDTQAFHRSFIFANPLYDEVWFCYPESGQVQPNRAILWNRGENKISEVDKISFRGAANATLEGSDTTTWADIAGSWDDQTIPWSSAYRRKVLLADAGSNKFLLLDDGNKKDGKTFKTLLQRNGIALVGKARDGSPMEDFKQRKMIERIWPKAEGGSLDFRIGYQDTPTAQMVWGGKRTFKPATNNFIDFADASGRLLAIEISTRKNDYWRFEGYKLEMSLEGNF